MSKRKVEYRPEQVCANCGGLHFGSHYCPYAVPYDADDPLGEKRGLTSTAGATPKKGPPMVQGEGE